MQILRFVLDRFRHRLLHPVIFVLLIFILTRIPFVLVIQSIEIQNDYQENARLISQNLNQSIRPIQYYHDRIDFHGEILMKPSGAKSKELIHEV